MAVCDSVAVAHEVLPRDRDSAGVSDGSEDADALAQPEGEGETDALEEDDAAGVVVGVGVATDDATPVTEGGGEELDVAVALSVGGPPRDDVLDKVGDSDDDGERLGSGDALSLRVLDAIAVGVESGAVGDDDCEGVRVRATLRVAVAQREGD